MNISKKQLDDAEKGQLVEIEEDDRRFVLISRDRYDQLSNPNADEIDPELTYDAVLEA